MLWQGIWGADKFVNCLKFLKYTPGVVQIDRQIEYYENYEWKYGRHLLCSIKTEICNLDRILHNKKLDFTNVINK